MIHVGCCGFPVKHATYYDALVVVEVQKTFYQPPRPATADRWRGEAPEDFEFTLKAWQPITHTARSPTYRRLRASLSEKEKEQVGGFRWSDPVRRAWDRTREIARRLAADKIVFQCPASFRPTDKNQDRLRTFFDRIDREGLVCAWEPRGAWTDEAVRALCDELDLVHCGDPLTGPSVTPGLRYWRLHGTTGYRHRYTDDELVALHEACPKTLDTYVLFNNRTMFEDARRFREQAG